MASQKTLIVTLGLVAVVATLALPPSAHPSLQSDADHPVETRPSPGMRRLTWWRWGRRNNDKKEKTTTESPTTTEIPVMDYITTTKKPSRWRSWFSRAKEKISNAAKKVKGKYERGMAVVDSVATNGFYKAGKAIVLGVKKVGNVTMKVGRKIKKGAKKIGSAVKRGYQKIRLKFSGPDEKFKILANRIKDKVESGDGRAVDLLKKLGIHITLSDQKITGSRVVNKTISVTEILQNEGMLSNKTASSYHTALEDPELTASIDSTGVNESVVSGISPAEEYDEFHSAEEYLTSEPNITDTKIEYERATTEGISTNESPISDTDRNETRSTIHQDTTTEISKSTYSEKVTFLTESSSQPDKKYNVESTSSSFPTEEERISADITVTIPSTDSVFKEDSVSSTKITDASDSHLYLTTISPFNESNTHSLVDQPFEGSSLSFTETSTHYVDMNKTRDPTTPSTISPPTAVDIDPAISVNTIHPLNLDISVPENYTSKILDEYKTTTLQHSSAVSINRDTSTAEAISLSTLHDTSPLPVTSPDFVTALSEETSSFTSTITATAPTSTSPVTYASTTLTLTTNPPTTSTSTLPPTTSTIKTTPLITSKIITTALAPTISISTTSDHLPTTSISSTATSIPTTTGLPSTSSTSTTTTLPPTTSTSTTIILPSIISKSTTTKLHPTTSTLTSATSIPTTTTLPSTTSTSTTTTLLLTSSTSTTTIPPPSTSTSTTLPSAPSTITTTTLPPTTSTTTTLPSTTSTSTTTTLPPTTSTSTTTTLPSTTSTTTTTTLPSTTSTSTTTTLPPTTSTSTTTILPSTTSTSTTTTLPPTTSTSTTTAPPPTTLVATIPPTTAPPPPLTTTTSSTHATTPAIKTLPPTFTETNKMHLPPTSPSTDIHGDSETIVEEAYVPPPFPDVFSDIEVHDRLREFYDNGDFSHAEMAELFNFDPDNYEYYKYDYNYEDYTN